ncbi:hypothetical protein QR680_006230 [Steinernema hermaphroditum]|uniref:TIL domain-containing protein n=1 Tax=Steinernema hermaphroditum TaxID=289476 RepID=A0AA39HUU8_9BILA|nr:hypothetical protein QR680_006230 [Steinernema hermaphroditum]
MKLIIPVVLLVTIAAARPPVDNFCGENEMMAGCRVCEATCARRVKVCPRMCMPLPPTCQCKPNFFRHAGKCVAAEACPIIEPIPEPIPASNITEN